MVPLFMKVEFTLMITTKLHRLHLSTLIGERQYPICCLLCKIPSVNVKCYYMCCEQFSNSHFSHCRSLNSLKNLPSLMLSSFWQKQLSVLLKQMMSVWLVFNFSRFNFCRSCLGWVWQHLVVHIWELTIFPRLLAFSIMLWDTYRICLSIHRAFSEHNSKTVEDNFTKLVVL